MEDMFDFANVERGHGGCCSSLFNAAFGSTLEFASHQRNDIKHDIMMRGPVASGFEVMSNFKGKNGQEYDSSDTRPATRRGYHQMTIMGWNDSLGCWIVKNSWGADSDNLYIKYGDHGIDNVIRAPRGNPNAKVMSISKESGFWGGIAGTIASIPVGVSAGVAKVSVGVFWGLLGYTESAGVVAGFSAAGWVIIPVGAVGGTVYYLYKSGKVGRWSRL